MKKIHVFLIFLHKILLNTKDKWTICHFEVFVFICSYYIWPKFFKKLLKNEELVSIQKLEKKT